MGATWLSLRRWRVGDVRMTDVLASGAPTRIGRASTCSGGSVERRARKASHRPLRGTLSRLRRPRTVSLAHSPGAPWPTFRSRGARRAQTGTRARRCRPREHRRDAAAASPPARRSSRVDGGALDATATGCGRQRAHGPPTRCSSRRTLSMYGAAEDASTAAALCSEGTGGGSGAAGERSRSARDRFTPAQDAAAVDGPDRTRPAWPHGGSRRHRPRERSHRSRNDWHAPRLSAV